MQLLNEITRIGFKKKQKRQNAINPNYLKLNYITLTLS